MRVALKIAYDGKAFHGYARQPKVKTVEGELIRNLITKGLIKNPYEAKLRSASRTDKKVSAFCNVVALDISRFNYDFLEILSEDLQDIIVYASAEVKDDFNPRYAKLRQYRYYLYSKDINIEKLLSAASLFTGEHDFSNFARIESHRNPVRTINNIVFSETDEFLVIDFFSKNFLWHQVRRIVSALEKIGKNKITEKQIIDVLENSNKKVNFGIAPPEPLILKNIFYDIKFKHNKKLLNKAKTLERNIILSYLSALKNSVNKVR